MKTKAMKKGVLAAAVIGAFGLSSSAYAGVIVDLFTDPPPPGQIATVNDVGATNNQAGPLPAANVIGAFRDFSLQVTQSDFSGTSTMRANNGVLTLSNDTGNKSIGVVTWDGSNNAGAGGASVNTAGLANANLTTGGATAFLTKVIAIDLGFNYKITVWDMDGDKSVLSAAVQQAIQPPGSNSDYLFSWFNLGTGDYCDGVASPPACADPTTQLNFHIDHTGGLIDFTRIGALQLELENPTLISIDLALGSIQTVPEPGTLALAGLALMGLAGLRRRKT